MGLCSNPCRNFSVLSIKARSAEQIIASLSSRSFISQTGLGSGAAFHYRSGSNWRIFARYLFLLVVITIYLTRHWFKFTPTGVYSRVCKLQRQMFGTFSECSQMISLFFQVGGLFKRWVSVCREQTRLSIRGGCVATKRVD